MSTKRKAHSARFKAKVALEAYKGDKTAAELVSAHKISSGQISTWKKCLIDGSVRLVYLHLTQGDTNGFMLWIYPFSLELDRIR
jgi:transposase-like protein